MAETTGSGELTRWPGSPWPVLVRGQRVTVTHGDGFSGEYRVTEVHPHGDGSETYTLEPAADVDARTHY